jgi:hypothetical protein
MNEVIGFKYSQELISRILNPMGLKRVKCEESKTLLMERSDIEAARAMFLRTKHQIRQMWLQIYIV